MFDNVGRKIMTLAKVIGILGIVAMCVSAILFLVGLFDDELLLILGAIGVGSGLVLLVSSWPIYAFGQITEDVRDLRQDVYEIKERSDAGETVVSDELPEI